MKTITRIVLSLGIASLLMFFTGAYMTSILSLTLVLWIVYFLFGYKLITSYENDRRKKAENQGSQDGNQNNERQDDGTSQQCRCNCGKCSS